MRNPREFFFQSSKIAIVRTDKLGDMVLTLPMLRAIRENYPLKYLTLISSKYTKSILHKCEYVDKILYLEDFNTGIREIFRNERFDVVFFPRPKYNECLSAFLSGQKLRVGSGYRWYSFLLNYRIQVHRKTAEKHEAEYNVNMVESLTGSELKTELVRPFIEKSYLDKILTLMNLHKLKKDSFIIIHPGSGGSSFEWNPVNFGLLAKKVFEISGLQTVITGNESDNEKCNTVHQISDSSVNLCSKLALEELLALISNAKLLIANSTGVIHLAAALGVKVIGLYPNSPHLSPKRWGPYSKDSICITPQINHGKDINDMNLIDFNQVFSAFLQLLK